MERQEIIDELRRLYHEERSALKSEMDVSYHPAHRAAMSAYQTALRLLGATV